MKGAHIKRVKEANNTESSPAGLQKCPKAILVRSDLRAIQFPVQMKLSHTVALFNGRFVWSLLKGCCNFVLSVSAQFLPISFCVPENTHPFLLQDRNVGAANNGLWVPGGQCLMILSPDSEASYIGTFVQSLWISDVAINIC